VTRPAERLGHAPRLAAQRREPPGLGERREGGGEVLLQHPAAPARLDELRVARAGRDRHRQARGHRLEERVGEGVVAGRQHEEVGGGVERLDVRAPSEEAHAVRHAEPRGERGEASRRVGPRHEQVRGHAAPGQAPQRPVEALALEAAADEEGERAVEAERPPRRLAQLRAAGRIEAGGVDAVRHHRQALGGDPVAARELAGVALRQALDDLPGIAEHGLLDGEQRPVAREEGAQAGPAVDALEIGPVDPAPRAVEVLVAGARVGVHHVEALAGVRGGARREGRHPQRLEDARHAQPSQPHPRRPRRACRSTHDGDVDLAPGELAHQLEGGLLDSAPARLEALDHHRHAHERAGYSARLRLAARAPRLRLPLLGSFV
jgi:hypothetical protein